MYKFVCKECGTQYSTSENRPPPPINWSDGHKCKLIKVKTSENDS